MNAEPTMCHQNKGKYQKVPDGKTPLHELSRKIKNDDLASKKYMKNRRKAKKLPAPRNRQKARFDGFHIINQIIFAAHALAQCLR